MSKILQSLPLTIAAGVVLTIILAFVTDKLMDSGADMPGAAEATIEQMNEMIP